jgi:hypothetical protein
MGSFAIALNGGSDSFVQSCARAVLTSRANEAFAALEADLRETDGDTVCVFSDGLPAGRCAVVFASARGADGTFQLDASYRPDWQAVIVYAPYTTSQSVRQLRRYVYYDDGYRFPFSTCVVAEDVLTLTDADGRALVVNRADGNITLAPDPGCRVFCPGVTAFSVDPAQPARASITATCATRGGAALHATTECDVGYRN